jgi:hypothetical protein
MLFEFEALLDREGVAADARVARSRLKEPSSPGGGRKVRGSRSRSYSFLIAQCQTSQKQELRAIFFYVPKVFNRVITQGKSLRSQRNLEQ